MDLGRGGAEPELGAILIAPDRSLAEQFAATLGESRAFKILAEMKSYPAPHTLEVRLRQIRPEIVLLDVSSDLEAASELIKFAVSLNAPVQVVGLSANNDPAVLLACLRLGASEFLHAPFDITVQRDAVSRLVRLRQPEPISAPQPGKLLLFSSVKPGSGASTLAIETACSVRRITGKRVLLADFDLAGGTLAFYARLSRSNSLLDALQNVDRLRPSFWSSIVSDFCGVDVLAAPETPFAGRIDSGRLNAVVEFARSRYDWVIIDLPVIVQRLSLMVLSKADRALLVSTVELPSLHLARKVIQFLEQVGYPKARFQMVVNRLNRRDDFARADIERLLNCPVYAKFPNDYFSLHRVLSLGTPLDETCDLRRAIDELAVRLTGPGEVESSASAKPVAARKRAS